MTMPEILNLKYMSTKILGFSLKKKARSAFI